MRFSHLTAGFFIAPWSNVAAIVGCLCCGFISTIRGQALISSRFHHRFRYRQVNRPHFDENRGRQFETEILDIRAGRFKNQIVVGKSLGI